MRKTTLYLATSLLLACAGANAGDHKPRDAAATPLPAWEQLSPAQRELLVAPIRERWNANPDDRARMFRHAERWHEMTPEQRRNARRGLRHWEHMDPARRSEMKALFQAMKSMTPEQRKQLRKRWHEMTPEQRRQWVEANPPAAEPVKPR